MPHKITIPIGARFGRLTVLGESPQRKGSSVAWGCRCDCGMIVIVSGAYLRGGDTLSCGCLLKDWIVASKTTHGMTESPEYKTWLAMRGRCLNSSNPKHIDYGGRGITICPEWDDFAVFYRDMGPKPSPVHSIDRIDVDGNYEASNCRWASPIQQARNRRITRYLTCRGQTKPLAEWAEITGLPSVVIHKRLRRGWTVERALDEALMENTNTITSRHRLLTVAGQTLTVAQWATVLGIGVNTLAERLRRGWTEERTLSTPLLWAAPTTTEDTSTASPLEGASDR